MASSVRGRLKATSTGGYLKFAPAALVELHSHIGPGKDILGCLLTDPKMGRPWQELSRYIRSRAEWQRLWGVIAHALIHAKRPHASKSSERDKYLGIAGVASQIANSIENSPLDLMSFELFTDDVMLINGVPGWGGLDSLARASAGYRLLREWPSVTDLLRELEARAQRLGTEAMTTRRPVARTTRDSAARFVALSVSDHLRRRYGKPLYGTTAGIVSVSLGQDVSKEFVAQAFKRREKGIH